MATQETVVPVLFEPEHAPGITYLPSESYWLTPYTTPIAAGNSFTVLPFDSVATNLGNHEYNSGSYIRVYFNNSLIYSADEETGNSSYTISTVPNGVLTLEYVLLFASNLGGEAAFIL